MKLTKRVQADLALIAITFIWGSSFTFVKEGLAQVSPVLFVALRFWIAAAVVAMFLPRQIRRISGKAMARGGALSLALFGGFIFQTMGLRDTTPSNSAFITSLSVLLVPLMGCAFFRNRPSMQTLSGILLATSGLALLLVDPGDFSVRPGDTLTLICAFLFAFHILFLGRFVRECDYRQLMFVQTLFSAILASLVSPFLEEPVVVWNPEFLFYLFVLGVLSTAVAFFVQGWAQQYSNPNHTALIFSLEPVFATLFAFWILNQKVSMREGIGGLLILVGILISEIRRKEKSGFIPGEAPSD